MLPGRRRNTAIFVVILQAVVIALEPAFGVMFLVIFGGLPLAVLSALVTLVYGLVVPVTALALTLLDGAAVIERRPADDLEPATA